MKIRLAIVAAVLAAASACAKLPTTPDAHRGAATPRLDTVTDTTSRGGGTFGNGN